jgi:hypothetical protein
MENREFRPELLSRRGEWTAWALALAASAGMLLLRQALFIPTWAWIFWFFLIFSGTSISLGNWMDRHTRICLDRQGIHFENGIRRAELDWSEIEKITVLPARFGQTVQVLGKNAHFDFKTIGEVRFQGEVRGRTGFADGQHILEVILREAKMHLVEKLQEAYYYTRG